jgi:hypothetical protein
MKTENRVSIIPLDEYLGIDKLPTTVTAEMMLWLAWWAQELTSYEKSQDAAEKFQKRVTFRDTDISDDLIRKIVNILGKMVHDADMALADRASSENFSLPSSFDKDGTIYIEADGAHLNSKKSGSGLSLPTSNTVPQKDGEWKKEESSWHQMKLGVVFTSDNIDIRHNQIGEPYHIINKREYTATLSPVETFKKMVFSVAVKNGYGRYKRTVFISDGAVWLANMVIELFPDAIHILDLYHLKKKVHGFSKEYIKSDMTAANLWAEKVCDLLEFGKKDEAIELLMPIQAERNLKPDLLKYIKDNYNKINYVEYRAIGLFVGSGVIESGNKVVMQARMKQAGQRWGLTSAQYMLTLRTKRQSDGLWEKEVVEPTRELYGRPWGDES